MNFLKGEIQSIEDGKCVVKLITGERITAAVDASRSELDAHEMVSAFAYRYIR